MGKAGVEWSLSRDSIYFSVGPRKWRMYQTDFMANDWWEIFF